MEFNSGRKLFSSTGVLRRYQIREIEESNAGNILTRFGKFKLSPRSSSFLEQSSHPDPGHRTDQALLFRPFVAAQHAHELRNFLKVGECFAAALLFNIAKEIQIEKIFPGPAPQWPGFHLG